MAVALEWWQGARARWARINEMSRLTPGEIDRLAQDVGMNGGDFLKIATQENGTAELLQRRLKALRLDEDEIRLLSPLLLRDLQVTCSLCAAKSQCSSDMDRSDRPQGWETYCPNAGTLATLT
jgi:hypothetical protein